MESNANNAPIFNQREIFGVDVFSVVNQFTKKVLISENMVKQYWSYKPSLIAGNSLIDNQQPRHNMCKVQRLSKTWNKWVEYSNGNGRY